MGQSLGNIVVAEQKSGFYCGEKKATEKKDHPGLSSAFNLDFIDCGNQPERAFPFPVPTCLAPSVCLESQAGWCGASPRGKFQLMRLMRPVFLALAIANAFFYSATWPSNGSRPTDW